MQTEPAGGRPRQVKELLRHRTLDIDLEARTLPRLLVHEPDLFLVEDLHPRRDDRTALHAHALLEGGLNT